MCGKKNSTSIIAARINGTSTLIFVFGLPFYLRPPHAQIAEDGKQPAEKIWIKVSNFGEPVGFDMERGREASTIKNFNSLQF